jgi:hypothetical protein
MFVTTGSYVKVTCKNNSIFDGLITRIDLWKENYHSGWQPEIVLVQQKWSVSNFGTGMIPLDFIKSIEPINLEERK